MCRPLYCSAVACLALLAGGCNDRAVEGAKGAAEAASLTAQPGHVVAQPLNWDLPRLVGTWRGRVRMEAGGWAQVEWEVKPVYGGQFVSSSLTFTNESREPLFSHAGILIWDAASKGCKCWAINSTGDHMSATFDKPRAGSWTLCFSIVRSDGVTGTATQLWKLVDNDTLVWEVHDRVWDNGTRSEDQFLELKRERKPSSAAKSKSDEPFSA